MELVVYKKNVYGKERYYPVNNLSKAVIRIIDRVTFDEKQLELWKVLNGTVIKLFSEKDLEEWKKNSGEYL